MTAPGPLEITALLAELGFDTPDTAALARAALDESGLTNPKKSRVDAAKRPRIEELLDTFFLPTCNGPACNAAADGRTLVRVFDLARCRICHGSSNSRGLATAEVVFAKRGLTRIVVVGGSPAVHDELRRSFPKTWEVRLVDGTGRRTGDQARADLKWAELVLIWGGTELDHKVSQLYTKSEDGGRDRVVMVNRRGIAALFEEAAKRVDLWPRR